MTAFLIIAGVLGYVLTGLIKGIVAFLQTTEAELNSTDTGPSPSSLKQNKAMMGRIAFQAIAILLVALLLLLHGGK